MVDIVGRRRALAAQVPQDLSQQVEWASQREPWDTPQRFEGSPNAPISTQVAGLVLPKAPSLPIAPQATAIYDKSRFPMISEQIVACPQNSNLFLSAPANKRVMLLLRNVSAAANVFVSFGTQASANSILRLTPNTIILMDAVVPQNDLYSFADAANGFLVYAYNDLELP